MPEFGTASLSQRTSEPLSHILYHSPVEHIWPKIEKVTTQRSQRLALGLNNLAVVLFDQGDLAAAQKAIDDQRPIFQQAGIQRGLAYAMFIQAKVLKEKGELDQARKSHEQVLAMRNKLGEKTTAEDSLLALAQLSIEEGPAADAEQPARQVQKQAEAEKERGNELNARATLARSLLEQGKTVEAEKEIRSAEATVAITEGRLLAHQRHNDGGPHSRREW